MGKKYEDWIIWYLSRNSNAISDATEKIYEMIEKLKTAITLIDKEMVREWTKDLVLSETFVGLCFQESILIKIAEFKKTKYRLSTPKEESSGIDGFIDSIPVSIKPITYKTKNMYGEQIDVAIVFYDKKKDGINIEFNF